MCGTMGDELNTYKGDRGGESTCTGMGNSIKGIEQPITDD